MRIRLPVDVSSHQDLKSVVLEIRQYAQTLAQAAVKSHVSGDDTYQPPAVSPAAIDLIQQWHGEQQPNRKSLDELIAALEELAAAAPRISITLAALPPNDLKKTLIGWSRQHIDPNILVEFKFNSALLGGLVVRYGSRIYDWSFRRQILAGLGKFPEVLRRAAHPEGQRNV